MKRRWISTVLLAVPLVVAGLVYGYSRSRADEKTTEAGYTCPLTGEELPCPKCCPLNQKQ